MRQLKIMKQVTSRDSTSLETYLREIGKIELITAEEEVDLARRIHQGDLDARDRLIHANLRFVISVSKQYQNQGLSLQDMINEGNLGLIKAAERFDETRGFKFISYAVWWIRQSIMQALAEQVRIVRLPVNRVSHINKIKKTFALLEHKYEREPTDQEISQSLDISTDDVIIAYRNAARSISMDAPLVQDEDNNMYDYMLNTESTSPDDALIGDSLAKEIDRVLLTLTPRDAEIVRMFYGLGGREMHRLEVIGTQLNLTRERVRQIKESAIRKLKHATRSNRLKTYLDYKSH